MGYAKVTGRIPAVLLHNSVGTLHAAMAIRAAYHAGDPLLIYAGDAFGKEDYESDSPTGWTWLNRFADSGGVESLVRAYVKWSVRAVSHWNIEEAVNHGCRIARQAPRGLS